MLPPEQTAVFFLRDTRIRLEWVIEMALAYLSFSILMYLRFLITAYSFPAWFTEQLMWIIVFVPLFVLDWRKLQRVSYLQDNQALFAPYEGLRYLCIVIGECIYKILLTVYLVFPEVRDFLLLKIVMLPFAVGYVLHFLLGHCTPLEQTERPEGCDVTASLLSELGRFLEFVLIIVISLKVENEADATGFSWEAAFWPYWGFEGILCIIITLLIPICVRSICTDRQQTIMLTWIIFMGSGLCLSSLRSVFVLAISLDNDDSDDQVIPAALWPWIAFLAVFCFITRLLKSSLIPALHAAWYQDPRVRAVTDALLERTQVELLPPPAVLFRITPTYYSRTFEDSFCEPAVQSTLQTPGMASQLTASLCSQVGGQRIPRDSAASILSARGATFAEMVESEQLCFICYDTFPDGVLLECGHAGMCVNCALQLTERRGDGAQCPICRAQVRMVVRLRLGAPFPMGLFMPVHGRDSRARSLTRSLGIDNNFRSTRSIAEGGDGDEENGWQYEGGQGGGLFEAGQDRTGLVWPASARKSAVVVEVATRERQPRTSQWNLTVFLR
uniref:RING-type domain-containing protein n=1 Tax=Noctiluca scintillans TaxID=2966 RepID=A0A7S1A2Z7_NOCSC|mmetsp:Transcript_29797/g.79216  ORF Transcript_29797/g.79216 Transcript_29797/m.79216 type:complete len:557 (+) Transcript_29797:103-1773(+)